jgi:UDP-N-acetylglucosamine acyltransferase
MTQISPLASVHPEARLGADVQIDPFVVIEENVEVGDRVRIGPHAHLSSGARIGAECRIFTGAAIGGVPQDLKFKGEETLVIVGERTVVREYVTLNRGTSAHGQTVIGSDCLLMAYCHVAHDCTVGDNVILANAVQLGGHVEIGEWAFIGGLTGIHQFERVGPHAMVAAGFRVMKDVPPFALAGSQPLSFSGINTVGLKRRGFAPERIASIQEIYRQIYQSGVNIGDGVELVEKHHPGNPDAELIVRFIRTSKRGVISLPR